MSDYLIAVIVGCVEGLTEFIPVSSTAHMIIVGHMLGFTGDFAALFDVFIQLGAILSIIFIYKDRFRRFLTKDGWDTHKGLSVWHVAMGMLPVCVVGFLAHEYIKTYLFSPFTAVFGLVLGALLMIYAEKKMGPRDASLVQDIDKMSLKQCLVVGFYQLLALWPGFPAADPPWPAPCWPVSGATWRPSTPSSWPSLSCLSPACSTCSRIWTSWATGEPRNWPSGL